MEFLFSFIEKNINSNIKILKKSLSRNYSFDITIQDKPKFLKIICLYEKYIDDQEVDKIIISNQKIINIYQKFSKKNITLPIESHSYIKNNNNLYQYLIFPKMNDNFKEINFSHEDMIYKMLNHLYEILNDNIVYFDIKIENFIFDNDNIFLIDFEDDYIKILKDEESKKDIFTLQFYLLYLSYRKNFIEKDFFKKIRFFGSKEKILDYFTTNKFINNTRKNIIYKSSIFGRICKNYFLNLNEYDDFFWNNLLKENFI